MNTDLDAVVIARGGDAMPPLRYEMWDLAHLPGSDLDGVRAVRDNLNRRVQAQLTTDK